MSLFEMMLNINVEVLEKHFLFRINQVHFKRENEIYTGNGYKTSMTEEGVNKLIENFKKIYKYCLVMCKLLKNDCININLLQLTFEKFDTESFGILDLMNDLLVDENFTEEAYRRICNIIKTDRDLLKNIISIYL